MDMQTGQLYAASSVEQMREAGFLTAKDSREMYDHRNGHTLKQVSSVSRRQLKRMLVCKNDKCPCGSGFKAKHCCLAQK
jgi:uncharacterized protein YecA (UPF0149 family)